MQGLIEWLRSEEGRLVLSGAMGGMARWLALKQGWPDNAISVALGLLCAVNLGPVVLVWLAPLLSFAGVAGLPAAMLSGFLAGVGGMTIIGLIIDAWDIRRKLLRDKGGDHDAQA